MFLILIALLTLTVVLYKKRCQQMSILKKLGIPGPKPNFIFGNAIEIAKEGSYRVFPKWTKKFGPVVGFYLGGRPQMLISDFDMIRQVMVKDFHLFPGRNQLVPGGVFPHFQKTIAFAQGNTWKQIRSIFSPWFSISKQNAMEALMVKSIDKIINELNEKAEDGGEFTLTLILEHLVFSLSTNCLLGVDLSLDHQTEEYQSFFKVSRPRLEKSILATTMMLFPSLTFVAYPLRVWWEKIRIQMLWSPEGVCIDVLKKCIQARKIANKKCNSFLQLMINAEGNLPTNDNDDSKRMSLTEKDIISNLIIMLIGAIETSVTILQFVIHNLVNNLDVQEKLRNDLKNAVEKRGGRLDNETVSSVPLLINVIKETLRMYSPGAIGTTRVAEHNYEYKGYRIQKGTGLFVDIHSIHNDPDFWPEPETFRPERFDDNIDKLAFMPFGVG